MLFEEDPTEQKPDIDTIDQVATSNGSAASDTFVNDPDEDSSPQSKGTKLDKDDDDDGMEMDDQGLHDPENGLHLSPKNGEVEPEENESSGDFNPRIEAVGTVDGNGMDVGVRMTQLQKEVSSLESLLISKEQEWNAILRLKKLKELLLEQLRRDENISSMFSPGELKDNQSLTKEYLTLDDKGSERMESHTKSFTANIKNEISKTELEITEIRTNRLQRLVEKPGSLPLEHRNASLALRQLSEKNSAELKQGRNGPIVPVTSLIADYRAKRKQESPAVSSSKKRARGSKASTQPSSNISYSDVLLSLAKISSESKSSDTSFANSSSVNTAKSNTRTGNVSAGTNKSQITLAKLLSTTGGTSTAAALRSDENKPADDYKTRQQTNPGSNSDTSISLSNLLASNKARNEPAVKTESVPICQGCNRNQAQFVCAGCGSQWYCSRECQVEAWDEHAESCSG